VVTGTDRGRPRGLRAGRSDHLDLADRRPRRPAGARARPGTRPTSTAPTPPPNVTAAHRSPLPTNTRGHPTVGGTHHSSKCHAFSRARFQTAVRRERGSRVTILSRSARRPHSLVRARRGLITARCVMGIRIVRPGPRTARRDGSRPRGAEHSRLMRELELAQVCDRHNWKYVWSSSITSSRSTPTSRRRRSFSRTSPRARSAAVYLVRDVCRNILCFRPAIEVEDETKFIKDSSRLTRDTAKWAPAACSMPFPARIWRNQGLQHQPGW